MITRHERDLELFRAALHSPPTVDEFAVFQERLAICCNDLEPSEKDIKLAVNDVLRFRKSLKKMRNK
jgi:hypothetical protein